MISGAFFFQLLNSFFTVLRFRGIWKPNGGSGNSLADLETQRRIGKPQEWIGKHQKTNRKRIRGSGNPHKDMETRKMIWKQRRWVSTKKNEDLETRHWIWKLTQGSGNAKNNLETKQRLLTEKRGDLETHLCKLFNRTCKCLFARANVWSRLRSLMYRVGNLCGVTNGQTDQFMLFSLWLWVCFEQDVDCFERACI